MGPGLTMLGLVGRYIAYTVSLVSLVSLPLAASLSCGDSRLTAIIAFDASVGDAPLGETSVDEKPAMDLQPIDVPNDLPPIVCPTALVGYAAETEGTRGGQGGMVVLASTSTALQMYAQMAIPLVIQIATQIPVTDQIRVASDKTIEGVGPGAELVGGGLNITDAHNVIISRLKISKAVRTDAISINNSNHVWIDHCDLSSDMIDPESTQTYDGLVDITHASDFVTVSWNVFHDHYRPSIVGHTNSAAAIAEDTNHLIVTYHHNHFARVASNTPRVRFGTVHVFNNLYEDVSKNAIISQMGASLLVEGNVFRNVPVSPITTVYEDPMQGFAWATDNRCIANCGGDTIQMTKQWTPPYSYNADSTDSVPIVVGACAGPKF